MTLGREDLLTKKNFLHRSNVDTNLVSGYIAKAEGGFVFKVVVFNQGMRLKGYVTDRDLKLLVDDRTGKITIHRTFPKNK